MQPAAATAATTATTLPPREPAFHHKFPPSLAHEALSTMQLSQRGHPPPFRRLYWYNQYRELVKSRIVFAAQNLAMTAQEYRRARLSLEKAGFHIIMIRNNLFAAAVHSVYDPHFVAGIQKPARITRGRVVRPPRPIHNELQHLATLAQGPTCIIFSNLSDTQAPNLIKDFAAALKPIKKLLFVGGKLDQTILTPDTFDVALALPPLAHLRSELIGLIQAPAQRLVHTLESNPSIMLATLQQHHKQLLAADSGDNTPDTPTKAQ
eukprot:jgi/Hompol1/2652/HPOL_002996-RA